MCAIFWPYHYSKIIKYTTVQKFGVSKFFFINLMLDKKYSNIVILFSIVYKYIVKNYYFKNNNG